MERETLWPGSNEIELTDFQWIIRELHRRRSKQRTSKEATRASLREQRPPAAMEAVHISSAASRHFAAAAAAASSAQTRSASRGLRSSKCTSRSPNFALRGPASALRLRSVRGISSPERYGLW
ncbi:hypothetical protein NL676_016564 [Syzygium grande]|nr:hypothetical protein NL676_016564 [Syzygium grande]